MDAHEACSQVEGQVPCARRVQGAHGRRGRRGWATPGRAWAGASAGLQVKRQGKWALNQACLGQGLTDPRGSTRSLALCQTSTTNT